MIFVTDKCIVRGYGTNFVEVELDLDAGDVVDANGKDFWKELLDVMDRENIKDYLELREVDE